MIEHRCPGPTSGLVEMLLLTAISVDRLSQLPQVNVACLNGRRTHDCRRTQAGTRSSRRVLSGLPGGIWSSIRAVRTCIARTFIGSTPNQFAAPDFDGHRP